MEFHQLRYFVTTAEELSVTAAAKRLGALAALLGHLATAAAAIA